MQGHGQRRRARARGDAAAPSRFTPLLAAALAAAVMLSQTDSPPSALAQPSSGVPVDPTAAATAAAAMRGGHSHMGRGDAPPQVNPDGMDTGAAGVRGVRSSRSSRGAMHAAMQAAASGASQAHSMAHHVHSGAGRGADGGPEAMAVGVGGSSQLLGRAQRHLRDVLRSGDGWTVTRAPPLAAFKRTAEGSVVPETGHAHKHDPNIAGGDATANAEDADLRSGHEFIVEFGTTDAMGLHLDSNLKVIDFHRGHDGKVLSAEATGWVRPGDTLVAVNEEPVEGLSFPEVAGRIKKADLPKLLRFHAGRHDDRASAVAEEQVAAVVADANAGTLTISHSDMPVMGDVRWIQADFGTVPPCKSHKLVFADPIEGCGAMANEDKVKGSIVIVERGVCAFSDKAVNVQTSGGVGVIVLNNDGPAFRMGGAAGFRFLIPAASVGHRDAEHVRNAMAYGLQPLSARLTRDDGRCLRRLDNGTFVEAGTGGDGRHVGSAGTALANGSVIDASGNIIGGPGFGAAAGDGGDAPYATMLPVPRFDAGVLVVHPPGRGVSTADYFNATGGGVNGGGGSGGGGTGGGLFDTTAPHGPVDDTDRMAMASAAVSGFTSPRRYELVRAEFAPPLLSRIWDGGRARGAATRVVEAFPSDACAPLRVPACPNSVAERASGLTRGAKPVWCSTSAAQESRAGAGGGDPSEGAVQAMYSGAIVLVQRGTCSFEDKAAAISAAGGAVALVANSEYGLSRPRAGRGAAALSADDEEAGKGTLAPTAMITRTAGKELRAAIREVQSKGASFLVSAESEGWDGGASTSASLDASGSGSRTGSGGGAGGRRSRAASAADRSPFAVRASMVGRDAAAAVWDELQALMDPAAWPKDKKARRKLYFRLSRRHHPDKRDLGSGGDRGSGDGGGSQERFETLHVAYRLANHHYDPDPNESIDDIVGSQ